MELFEIRNKLAFPSVHALMIEPFKTIWISDTSPEKTNAIKLFTYVDLLCNPRKSNPFYTIPEEKRPTKVKMEVYQDANKPDTDFMILAITKYKSLLAESSPSLPLLESSMVARDKIITYFSTFDFSARTTSGALVIKPKDITNALKDIDDVTKKLSTLMDKVNSELEDDAKTRNKREIGRFEE